MLKTCATCGELTAGTYCPSHTPADTRRKDPQAAGYDAAWRKLSRRARRLQPFCSDCGTTKDLTTDHTPQAWERKAAGKPITLDLVDVVCRSCNSRRGAARGEKTRGVRADESEGTALGRVFLPITFDPDLKVCEEVVPGGGS